MSDWANFTKPVCGLWAQLELNRKSPVPQIPKLLLLGLKQGNKVNKGRKGWGSGEKGRGENFLLSDETVFTSSFQTDFLTYGVLNVCLLCLLGYLLQ